MKLKKILLFLLFLSIFSYSQVVSKEINNFVYSGRVELSNPHLPQLIAPASSVAFRFIGNSVAVKIKNKPNQGYYNYISVEIDSQYIGRFKVEKNDYQTFNFEAKDITKKNHEIIIYKATEASMGEVIIDVSGVTAIPWAPTTRMKIEFIGDSITCGYGNDESGIPCGQGQWFDQHNAYFAYGPIVSRMLGTDFLLSSVSGYGMYRNWNSEKWEEDILPDVYDFLFLRRNQQEKFEDNYQPDLVSICLGTNDLSDGDGKKERLPFNKHKYIGNYIEFIRKIYKKYPNTRVALLTSPMVGGEKNKLFVECLKEVKHFFENDTKHKPIEVFEFPAMTPSGCGYHPSIEDDKKMAEQLYPFYKKLLNN